MTKIVRSNCITVCRVLVKGNLREFFPVSLHCLWQRVYWPYWKLLSGTEFRVARVYLTKRSSAVLRYNIEQKNCTKPFIQSSMITRRVYNSNHFAL